MSNNQIQSISPTRAQQKMAQGVLMIDVREYPEWDALHVPGSTLMPLSTFSDNYKISDSEILLLCRSGNRAEQAAQIVAKKGGRPLVIEGGIIAWEEAGFDVQKSKRKFIPLDRQMRIAAGFLVLLGLLLPVLRPISYIVGCGLLFSGITGWCGMMKILAILPWNKKPKEAACPLNNEVIHG